MESKGEKRRSRQLTLGPFCLRVQYLLYLVLNILRARNELSQDGFSPEPRSQGFPLDLDLQGTFDLTSVLFSTTGVLTEHVSFLDFDHLSGSASNPASNSFQKQDETSSLEATKSFVLSLIHHVFVSSRMASTTNLKSYLDLINDCDR